jgi:3D (Asp-Asp-Asp) domain-containing protein
MPGSTPAPDHHDLSSVHAQLARLTALARRRRHTLCLLGATSALLLVLALWSVLELGEMRRLLSACRTDHQSPNGMVTALASFRQEELAAQPGIPDPGPGRWSDHFTVTMHTPYDPAYGKTNDGLTALNTKADPDRRIVAVDPRLIPYRSSVWVEGLGWHTAEDCGGAIKGFRLDVLTHTRKSAFAWGRRKRRVVVVPPAHRREGTRISSAALTVLPEA